MENPNESRPVLTGTFTQLMLTDPETAAEIDALVGAASLTQMELTRRVVWLERALNAVNNEFQKAQGRHEALMQEHEHTRERLGALEALVPARAA